MARSPVRVTSVHAPDFPPGLEWLNAPHPLTLAALRGKFVLLDFWTYGCINCQHIIPDLQRLEATYPAELVVIGVHSAKFAREGEIDGLRQVVRRYGIVHPVVSDPDYAVWQSYAVRAWPTLVLIDPRGMVIAIHSGEGVWEAIAPLLENVVPLYDRQGAIDRRPLPLGPEQAPLTSLSFPGKVLADEPGDRLFIADTGHHRIVVTTLSGRLLDILGAGAPGLADGSFDAALLRAPQGMALAENRLYIADTGNHAIRVASLGKRQVTTLAGDGTQQSMRRNAVALARARLNSPWDVSLLGRTLYIAMAGTHQVWTADLEAGLIGPLAGSGAEALVDGSLAEATMAQPSGITTDGNVLYVADAEASAIRVVELGDIPRVRTLTGRGLFEFGDRDGPLPIARLQHALGVTHYRGRLYVADTYNHRIKLMDLAEQSITSIAGDGHAGRRDGPARAAAFDEPGGLSGAVGCLYIADTNNHAVRLLDLEKETVLTLALDDPRGLLGRPVSGPAGTGAGDMSPATVALRPQRVLPGRGSVRLRLTLPVNYYLNPEAPSSLAVASDGLITADEGDVISLRGHAEPLTLAATFREGKGRVALDATIYYCSDAQRVCRVIRAQYTLPLTVAPDAGTSAVSLSLRIPV